jgi:hypothetical protein
MALRVSQDIDQGVQPEYADLISRNLIELPLAPENWGSPSGAGMRR